LSIDRIKDEDMIVFCNAIKSILDFLRKSEAKNHTVLSPTIDVAERTWSLQPKTVVFYPSITLGLNELIRLRSVKECLI
jgi:hypothetical protein